MKTIVTKGLGLRDYAAGKIIQAPGNGQMKPFCGTRETIRKQMLIRHQPTDGAKARREARMNHSIHSADRGTHLKIVVVALVAGIAVAAFGIAARTNADYSQTAQSTHVLKAGKPVAITNSGTSTIR
jgi:hypothetical protein